MSEPTTSVVIPRRVPGAAEDIRDPIGDPVGERGFALGRQTAGAQTDRRRQVPDAS
jgi:hypothetical protein